MPSEALPAATDDAIPVATRTYPPATTGHGPDPLYGRAERIGDAESVEATEALTEARGQLARASSFRFWLSIAGTGPAGDGLETGEPLILSGVAAGTPTDPAAAWSVTSPLGHPKRTINYVVLDGTVWCDSGVGIWTVFDGTDAELARADAMSMAPPSLFASTFLDDSIDVVAAARDHLDGTPAHRLEARDPAALPLIGWWLGLDGEVKALVLWVGETGTPLQAEVTGTVDDGMESGPFRMLLQVDAVDDPRNSIEPPR